MNWARASGCDASGTRCNKRLISSSASVFWARVAAGLAFEAVASSSSSAISDVLVGLGRGRGAARFLPLPFAGPAPVRSTRSTFESS